MRITSKASKARCFKARGSVASVVLSFMTGVMVHAAPLPRTPLQSEAVAVSQTAPRQKATTAQDLLDRLDTALALSGPQRANILPVLQKLQDELANLKASGAVRGADDPQIFTLTAMAQVRRQLTEAQQQAFDGMREDRRRELFRFDSFPV